MLDLINLDVESTENDFKMDMTVEFNKLNVLVGMNGSGKTLIMKFAWFAGYMLQAYKVMLKVEPERTDEMFMEMLQKVFTWTFDEPQDMLGTIEVSDKNREKFAFKVSFKNGLMDHFNMEVIDPKEFSLGNVAMVQFNSKEARTFEQYGKYLKLKKRFGFDHLSEEALDDICDIYKLYDVLWFEQLIVSVASMAKNGPNDILKSATGRSVIHSIFEGAGEGEASPSTELVAIKDVDSLPTFVMADASEKKALSLSSGQQAMLMMIMFAGAQ